MPSVSNSKTSNDTLTDDKADFVLVWDGIDHRTTSNIAYERRRIFEKNLENEGLILERKSIISKNLNFILIQAPLEVLKRYGEILKFRMPIRVIERVTDKGRHDESYTSMTGKSWVNRISNNLFGVDQKIFPRKRRKITTIYSRDKEYLFEEEDILEFFTPAIRARIVQYILKRKRYKEGDDSHQSDLSFGYDRLITIYAYCAAYPLHDGDYTSLSCQRGLLLREWGYFENVFKYQPLDAIKDYFGPKIGTYFAWLGFYTYMLIPSSLLGLIVLIYGLSTLKSDKYTHDVCNSNVLMCPLCDTSCHYWKLKSKCIHSEISYVFDNEFTALYAFFMSIWTIVFLEFWKRYSSEINHEWDLNGYDENDLIPRPEFLARLEEVEVNKLNFVTNTVEPAIPFWKMKLPYTLCSISTMLILIIISLAAVFGVIIYRLAVFMLISEKIKHKPDKNSSHSSLFNTNLVYVNISAACINLTFIFIFNRLYMRIAKYITEIEIPRTQSDYETSYAFKIFILQFISHYASIFYVAYFKGNFVGTPNNYTRYFNKWRKEECGITCMPELCIQLAVIMIGTQVKNVVVEMFFPFIKNLIRKLRLRSRDLEVKVEVFEHQYVKDYELLDWENDLTKEYLEMVIQYGFVTIFVSAFPLAPLFALINNYIEVRLDAQKLIKYYKRPIWRREKGIGIWYDVMDGIAKFAVLSNAFILAITSNFIPKLIYRFFHYSKNSGNYGSLDGFLAHTLTTFNTSDIKFLPSDSSHNICSFTTQRFGHNDTGEPKYRFKELHWKIWLARVAFVIAFENIAGVSVLFLKWLIPDIPSKLQDIILREEFITNEIIIQEELMKARGVLSEEADQIFGKVVEFEDEETIVDYSTDLIDLEEPPQEENVKKHKNFLITIPKSLRFVSKKIAPKERSKSKSTI